VKPGLLCLLEQREKGKKGGKSAGYAIRDQKILHRKSHLSFEEGGGEEGKEPPRVAIKKKADDYIHLHSYTFMGVGGGEREEGRRRWHT